jgi:hypothetical protein
VAHEPPLIQVLPDAEAADRACGGVWGVYEAGGRRPAEAFAHKLRDVLDDDN